MSFMGGAECSTAGNPLSQFTKHVQDDRSLQRDRLVNNGLGNARTGFRSGGPAAAQDEAVNGFLQQGPNLPEMAMEPHAHLNSPLPMDQARNLNMRAQSASPTWSGQMPGQMPGQLPGPRLAKFNVDEYFKFQMHQQQQQNQQQAPAHPQFAPHSQAAGPSQGPAYQAPSQMPFLQQQQPLGMSAMAYAMAIPSQFQSQFGSSMYNGFQSQAHMDYVQQLGEIERNHNSASRPAKGKEVVELDDHQWEEQFARMDMHDKEAVATSGNTQQSEDAVANAAIERELDQVDKQVLNETNFGDLEAVWNGIQAENAAMREGFDGQEWDDVTENTWGDDWEPLNYRMGMDPRVDPYQFEEENLFKEQANPFEEGVRIMNENGNLSLAALAFEAACQREPERVEAWVYLGSAQAQNEKETAAIRALEHALKLDPTNLAALMALAVSYTNEGYDTTAYRTLERWLSAKYPAVLPPAELSAAADVGFTDREKLHKRITDKFIEAAQLSPDGEHMDPDVQVGLGVLLYGGEDFDKAVDCFHAALASSEQGTSNQRSQLHLLWNRLGATLANSGRSEEAIAAYEKALALHPNFVRARYNLGVSCINMGCYQEAASHLLSALAMHKEVEKSGREQAREILGGAGVTDEQVDQMTTQNRSTTLHDTLRRVFGLMDRRDLADRVSVDMDPDIFRAEFDF